MDNIVKQQAIFNCYWCNKYKNDIIKQIKLCNSLLPPANCSNKIEQEKYYVDYTYLMDVRLIKRNLFVNKSA